MNPLHVHLVLNHFPVLGVFFGLALLLAASLRKSDELARAGLAAFALSAAAAVPVFFSGEGAEDLVRPLLGLPEALVERHEEAAELSLWLVGPLGAISLALLWRFRAAERLPSRALAACFAVGLAAAAALTRAAAFGGQLRHPEVQPDWKETVGASRQTPPDAPARED